MLKFFCDRCGGDCKAEDSSAHRFDALEEDIGLEVILVCDGQISANQHICDNCLADILLLAVHTFPKSNAVTKHLAVGTQAKQFEEANKVLEAKVAEVDIRALEASKKMLEACNLIARAEDLKVSSAEQIAVLSAQLGAVTAKLNSVLRVKAGAEKQLESDIKDNPEYIQNVERRERIRISGK